MRKSLAVAALAVLVCLSTTTPQAAAGGPPSGAASAAGGLHRSAGSTAKPYESGKINPHLTEGECTALGGNVGSEDACLSGKVCDTTNEKGQHFFTCISKAS